MAKEITELKCRDCQHFVMAGWMAGWWERYKICELTGYCVEPDESACISVKTKR